MIPNIKTLKIMIVFSAVLMLIPTLCFAGGPITLTFRSGLSADHPWQIAMMRWMDRITEQTNEQVEFEVRSDLCAECDIRVSNVGFGDHKETFKIGERLLAFFYGTDMVTAREVWEILWNRYPEIRAEYDTFKVKRLWGHSEMEYWAMPKLGTGPILVLSDFAGKTVNVGGMGETAGLFTPLGATEVAGPGADVNLTWLEGLLTMNSIDNYQYATNMHFIIALQDFCYMKKEVWDSLPHTVRTVFEKNKTYIEDLLQEASINWTMLAEVKAKMKGYEFYDLSPEDLNTWYSLNEARALTWAQELDALGLPGTKIFKNVRFLIEQKTKHP